jgi:hypothetical protein
VHSDTYTTTVKEDIKMAQNIGVQVPFVFDIYGFWRSTRGNIVKTLEKCGKREIQIKTTIKTTDGDSCGIDGCK